MVHQGYIEPFSSTALWSADGHVTIWTSTQGTFGSRSSTAAILGIPESMVKVIPMEIGGGFGGKGVAIWTRWPPFFPGNPAVQSRSL
jgi:CO/xanthine dehydrogenase Mo-binding subunit